MATCERPDISVIIPAYNAHGTIAACLQSLQIQRSSAAIEVLVVDSSSDGTAELVAARFPEVRLLRHSSRLYPGDARNRGVAAARADLIAFIDADCSVSEGWARALLEAHRSPWQMVGGAVENGSPASPIAWAYYFCEFNLWLPARAPRAIAEMATLCLSVKRQMFDRYGPFIEDTYCSDTVFHWKTSRDGHRVLFVPDIRVYHHVNGTLAWLLGHIFAHRRSFARVSWREKRLSFAGRALRMLPLPLLPFLLMAATLLRLRRCPSYLPRFLAVSPLVLLGFAARALGEGVGYIKP